MTRVLYCIDAMALGGTEKQLALLLAGLDRTRFEPFLCTLRPSTVPLDGLGCPVLELTVGSLGSPSAFRSINRLRRFLLKHDIDVVHTFFQDATIVGLCASAGTSVSLRVAAVRDLGFWRATARVWPLRLAYRFCHGFIVNSRAVAEYLHEAERVPLASIEIIYNGVRTRSAPTAAGSRHVIVGMVANLNRGVKRVDLFLDTARQVRDQNPGVKFIIVGDGPLRTPLMTQSWRLGLADAVRFVGSTDQVDELVGTFDVGVLTSDSEGLSNAILEYMAAGVPTVARDVGGNRELVGHDVTGLLVNSDRAADLAGAILRLVDDRDLRRRMGKAALDLVKSRYSVEQYVRHHEEYYNRLLARHDTLEVETPNASIRRTNDPAGVGQIR